MIYRIDCLKREHSNALYIDNLVKSRPAPFYSAGEGEDFMRINAFLGRNRKSINRLLHGWVGGVEIYQGWMVVMAGFPS